MLAEEKAVSKGRRGGSGFIDVQSGGWGAKPHRARQTGYNVVAISPPTRLILIKDSLFQSRWRLLYLYHLTTFPLPYKAQLGRSTHPMYDLVTLLRRIRNSS